jgi:Na+-translocating ferredoxin:NAD+ oxidoreductase RnfC subunit
MKSRVVEAVREAGIVGAGGAGFPAYAKLSGKARWVIVNGAECEPLLRLDPYLLERRPDAVLRGLQIAMETTGAEHGYVAIKAKHTSAVARLEEAVRPLPNVSVFRLGDFYPAGDEHVLVHEVLGLTVPQGGIPPQVGVLVNNVQTLMQVAAAVDEGQPVVDKWLTVAGWVKSPVTVRVPIGTPVREVLQLAGGPSGEPYAVIEGGPMTGRVLESLDEPVTRVTGGLIVLPSQHRVIVSKRRRFETESRLSASICCGCRLCTDLCPRNLLGHALHPHRITRAVALNVPDSAPYLEAFLCVQCSVCDLYACPMGLSPRRLFAQLKAELGKAGVRSPYAGDPVEPSPDRRHRLIPTKRLVSRLGLNPYDVPAPMVEATCRPARVTLPLLMGIGAPAQPVVQAGERVERGQVVARHHPDRLGVSVHASISGIIEAVTDRALVIRAEG